MTVFLAFALIAASSLIITSPRPANAEGPLLNGVRCLVKTVLWTQCSREQSTAPSSPAAPAPTFDSTPESNTSASQSSRQAAPAKPVYVEEITPNEALYEPLPEYYAIKDPATLGTEQRQIKQSDYVAYFNHYSRYAVANVDHAASAEIPIKQSTEGWKILGVAWYWWGLGVVLLFSIFLSVKKGFFRRYSVLSNTP